MKAQRFYVCQICGNLVGMIYDSGMIPVCCGKPMTELKANTADASLEKHVPVIDVSDSHVDVRIGESPHPMNADHWIQWIYLMTSHGGHRYELLPGMSPHASFSLQPGERPFAAFAYCNLHGLWKNEIS